MTTRFLGFLDATLSAVTMIMLLPLGINAQFDCATNSGELTITSYTGPSGDVTIPSTINGLPVTGIGDHAFAATGISSITIPQPVRRIGSSAFNYCLRLSAVTIPDSVTSLEDWSFAYCWALRNVTLPSHLITIGAAAFYNCTGLTSVTVPTSVNSIGTAAFEGCLSLTNVAIGNNFIAIGDFAFHDCHSLKAIAVDPQNPNYTTVSGILFNKSQTVLITCPEAKTGTYGIPVSVTSLANYAFYGSSLTTVMFPQNVRSIGDYAFQNALGLRDIYFCGNAPNVGGSPFPSPGNATVYRLPGTAGWDPLFEGLPVVIWRPQIQSASQSFGVLDGLFGFSVTWASGTTVVVEVATNLANSDWMPLATNVLAGGSAYFSDPYWTNCPARFYRLRGLDVVPGQPSNLAKTVQHGKGAGNSSQ